MLACNPLRTFLYAHGTLNKFLFYLLFLIHLSSQLNHFKIATFSGGIVNLLDVLYLLYSFLLRLKG